RLPALRDLRDARGRPGRRGRLHAPAALRAGAGRAGGLRQRADRRRRNGAAIPLPLREPSGALAGPTDTPVRQLAARPWRIDYSGPAGAFTTFPSEPL